MTISLAFTERAAADIVSAFDWYEMQQSGLGVQFRAALDLTLLLAMTMPEAGPIVHADLRRLLMRRFPYAVYYRYRISGDVLEVRGCLHQRRHPWVLASRA